MPYETVTTEELVEKPDKEIELEEVAELEAPIKKIKVQKFVNQARANVNMVVRRLLDWYESGKKEK